MNTINKEHKNMMSDTFVYLIAKFLEGIIGIVTISSYTYYFNEVAYGQYITINTTIQIVSAFATVWLSQSMYRFYKKYQDEDRMNEFYSTSFVIWFVINLVISASTLVLIFSLHRLGIYDISPFILVIATLSFVFYNTQTILTTTLASSRKTKFNLFISCFSAFGKLISITLLVMNFENSIVLIFISNSLIDMSVSILATIRLKIFSFVKLKSFSKDILQDFLAYGTPFIGSILTTTLINNSDRYIMDIEYVAIYVTNYSIVSTLFTMINTGISRGTVPTIYNVHTRGDVDEAYSLVSKLVKYYLTIIVPLVFGILVVSEQLSALLFPPTYKEAHMVMFFVGLALTFSFLTECSNKAFELNKNTKNIFKYSLIGGLSNLILNLILIPRFGYMVAGYTTLLGFVIYFLLSKYHSVKYIKWNLGKAFYIKVIGTSILMAMIVEVLKLSFGTSFVNMIVYIVIAVVFYFGVSYANGLLKVEIDSILKIINDKYKKRG